MTAFYLYILIYLLIKYLKVTIIFVTVYLPENDMKKKEGCKAV